MTQIFDETRGCHVLLIGDTAVVIEPGACFQVVDPDYDLILKVCELVGK